MTAKIIACGIYRPYLEKLDLSLDITWIDVSGHDKPKLLSQTIQGVIDEAPSDFDRIIVLYGLCGGTVCRIHANKIPVYVIRTHDCLAVLLGSEKRRIQLFSDRPSAGWSCIELEKNPHTSYEKYDQETQEYLRKYLDPPKDIYITFHLPQEESYEKKYSEIITGDLNWVTKILMGDVSDMIELCENEQIREDIDQIMVKEKTNGNLTAN